MPRTVEPKQLKWVCNTSKQVSSSNVILAFPLKKPWLEALEEAVQAEKAWRKQFVEGEPVSNSHFSVEELKEMGMIGLYAAD